MGVKGGSAGCVKEGDVGSECFAERGKDNLSGFHPRDPSSFLFLPVENKSHGVIYPPKAFLLKGFFFILFFHFELMGLTSVSVTMHLKERWL